jgi:hypothetical protein
MTSKLKESGFTISTARIRMNADSIIRVARKENATTVDIFTDNHTRRRIMRAWLRKHQCVLEKASKPAAPSPLGFTFDSYSVERHHGSALKTVNILSDQWFDDLRKERLTRGWPMIALLLNFKTKRATRITFTK